jgi:hypothetical protein
MSQSAVVRDYRALETGRRPAGLDTPVTGMREHDYRNGMNQLLSGTLAAWLPGGACACTDRAIAETSIG